MTNSLPPITINLPIGGETLRNVSYNFEKQMLKTLLETLQNTKFPPDYRGAFAIAFIMFLILAILISFYVKRYRRNLCNGLVEEAERDAKLSHQQV